jgi:hypothetical protein
VLVSASVSLGTYLGCPLGTYLGCPLDSTVSLGRSGCVSVFPLSASRGRTLPRGGSRRGDSFVPFAVSYLSFVSFVSSVFYVSSASAGYTWSSFWFRLQCCFRVVCGLVSCLLSLFFCCFRVGCVYSLGVRSSLLGQFFVSSGTRGRTCFRFILSAVSERFVSLVCRFGRLVLRQ